MIKEIIVVEGKDDSVAIKRAVEADTIETGGSAINREIIDRIRLAKKRRGVIVFTDPDHAGERIRRIIMEHVPGCKHAFVSAEEAAYNGKVGVEHCDVKTIRRALSQVKTEYEGVQSEISWSDMLASGLTNHPQAAERRRIVGKALKIGYANAKQFLKRCQIFSITKQEFYHACDAWINQMEQERGQNEF